MSNHTQTTMTRAALPLCLAALTGAKAHALPPSNDNCSNPMVLTGTEVTISNINNAFATTEWCEATASCAPNSSRSLWYSYTPVLNGAIFVGAGSIGEDWIECISIHVGCSNAVPPLVCVPPAELACGIDDPNPFVGASVDNVPVQAGQTYLIRLASATGQSGSCNLSLTFLAGLTGDACVEAPLIPTYAFNPPPFVIDAANAIANEPQEDCETWSAGVSNSVFFKFIAMEDGEADIYTLGSTYDTVLSVFNGCGSMFLPPLSYSPPALLACNNDAEDFLGTQSVISNFPMQAGQTYIIKVAGNGPGQDTGMLDFNFHFTPAPPPPACPADIAPSPARDGSVNVTDLLELLASWGACGGCPADINGSDWVDVTDLLDLLAAWGPCG